MKGAHAAKRLNVGAGDVDMAAKAGGAMRSGGPKAAAQPSAAELDAFYLDPSSLTPDRLIAVESFVQRHPGGEGTRAEYLRYRRRLQAAHRQTRRETD